MAILIILVILVLIGIAFHYYSELENAEDCIFRLESRVDDLKRENKKLVSESEIDELKSIAYQAEQRATKHFSKLEEIRIVISENQYDSVINLQNKIKSILDNCDTSNID